MNKLIESYEYDFKYKYFIISKIKNINNQCKNGCRVKVDNKYIYIEANNKNTILLAYELIKKEIKSKYKEDNNTEIVKKEVLDNKNINNFEILNNENIIECIQYKPIIMNNINILNNKKEHHIYKILKDNSLSNEEKKRNKIALKLLEEEERLKNKLRKKSKLTN
tara:strand:+ start:1229 stop:1723 length:495 start_codon:yes stop_codon:yes gene_type:complete